MIKKTLVLSMVLVCMSIWTTNSFCQDIKQTSKEVLQYGKLRCLLDYYQPFNKSQSISNEISTKTTLVISNNLAAMCYLGLPEKQELDNQMVNLRQYVRDLHDKGVLVISHLATTRFRGDPEKRSLFFDFYDFRWDQYENYFGPKPIDPVEWARLDSRGKPCSYNVNDRSYGRVPESAVCFNHPAVKQYVHGSIKLQLEFGIDGIFLDDSPIFCYCSICNDKFRTHLKNNYCPDELIQVFGVSDVSEVDPGKFMEERLLSTENPLVTEWKRFRVLDYTEHLKAIKAYGESLKPGFILTDNACLWEGDPYRAFNYAVGPIEEWAKGMSFIFIEAQFDAYSHGGQNLKVTNSPVLKYTAGASHGIPAVYLGYLGDPTSKTNNPLVGLSPLVKLCIAECNANQASYNYIPTWDGYGEDVRDKTMEEIMKGVSEYNNFLAKNEDLFLGSKPYTNVALLISTEQTYAGHETYAMAVSRMLLDEQIPHVMLVDDDVKPEILEKYDLVILPDVPMMSEKKINIFEKYVENGGGLLSLGASSKYDEFGRMRKKLGLSRLFEGMEPWGHMDPSIDQTLGVNAVSKNGYGKGRVIFIPSEAYASLPMTGREEVVIFKDLAFVTAAKLVSLNQVFGELVQWAAGGTCPVYCIAPYTVECHPLIQPDKSRIVVHLVNYKVDLEGNIIEEKNTGLKVLLPESAKVKNVKFVSPDDITEKVLEIKEVKKDGQNFVEFIVPSVSIYSLAVIEYMVR